MRVTLVQPCLGRRVGEPTIRSWQMEPLAPAVLAALTPHDVDLSFHDDRMVPVPFDEPTDLVALSVETYTARRAYQIASEYRKRGVPVVMGGFHATLVPDEVARYAEAVVVGEAEELWPRVVDDARSGRLQPLYQSPGRPSLAGVSPDRSLFAGKRYLSVALAEAGRGCRFGCEFCAVQTFFGRSRSWRPVDEVVAEVRGLAKPLVFFVDDNIAADLDRAKELLAALVPLKIRWVSQASLDAAHDEEFLALARASGCQGLLVGFETLEPSELARMNKTFNAQNGGYAEALANLRRHRIRLYATFLFGYDGQGPGAFRETLAFALHHKFYLAAFNHVTPFPGTPLYGRLEREGRLLFDRWWLDPGYRYGMLPFTPEGPSALSAQEVADRCVEARSAFFGVGSILRRALDFQVNCASPFMGASFLGINYLMRREVLQRRGLPLGDEGFRGPLLPVDGAAPERPAGSAG
ncbi:MAG: B12-binding domain-containing radical SAM protein [Deltaproteobacteria bacterium]|nr:B12-binding domain-containing radical SAM protein [Deltaproteobacteria bacterium]